MNPEGHYLQNTISRALFRMKLRSQCTFFQGRIPATCMPQIRACLFVAISKAGMCLLTSLCFKRFTVFGFQLAKVSKKMVLGLS